MDTLFGLPAHPLLVHLPVVLVPLAFIGVVLMAIRPPWVLRFGWVVAVLAWVGFVGAVLAADSGESLQGELRRSGRTISATLHDHAEVGDQARLVIGVFAVMTLAWVAFTWWRRRAGDRRATAKVKRPRAIAIALLALAVLTGAWATVTVTQTGHSGAKSVWETKGRP